MTARALSCEEVLALLSEYIDGELEPEALGALEAHLDACDGCTEFGEEFTATVQALREHLQAAPSLPDRLRRKLSAMTKDPEG